MINKQPLVPSRLRGIGGSFAFIEHRFLRDGFWASLEQPELLLYFFLLLAGDRQGLSYYGYDRICTLLRFSLEEYLLARDGLIDKDLIAFDGRLFQVLSLPEQPVRTPSRLLDDRREMRNHDPATISRIITTSLGGEQHD